MKFPFNLWQFLANVGQQPGIRAPLAIALGAIAGALTRYYFSMWLAKRLGSEFPYSTLVVNVTGCLVMGFFATLTLEKLVTVSTELRLLVAVGFLGSYTTFSTYSLDSLYLLRDRHPNVALLYLLGSAAVGIFSAYLGSLLARFWQ